MATGGILWCCNLLGPGVHTGAAQNFPEESPLNTLRYLFNDSPLLLIRIVTFFMHLRTRLSSLPFLGYSSRRDAL